jgi:hypothetical protein
LPQKKKKEKKEKAIVFWNNNTFWSGNDLHKKLKIHGLMAWGG